jgi:hypothetical protein
MPLLCGCPVGLNVQSSKKQNVLLFSCVFSGVLTCMCVCMCVCERDVVERLTGLADCST